jgi:nucleoside-diphosphate-sugar epimerase
METLLCFGFGYCAQHYVGAYGSRFTRVAGTTRSDSGTVFVNRAGGSPSVEMLRFDGTAPTASILAAINEAEAVLVSIPPGEGRDPVLRWFAAPLSHSPRLAAIVYLSTIGVYGDHGGGWVDEGTPPHPSAGRRQTRLAAELEWRAAGAKAGAAVSVLRLAGIYGPDRNALANVLDGSARRIVKPGQVFNRIHVADIAQAIEAAFAQRASGVYNVADDEPSPPQDVTGFAANLLGMPPPPQLAFEDAQATLSPMARSFYGENRRIRNQKLKTELGVTLRYPTYRDGLRALLKDARSRLAKLPDPG